MKRVTFLGQMHYFSCCIPSQMEGYEIVRMNYDHSSTIDLAKHETDVWVLFRPDFLLKPEQLRSMRGKKIWVSSEAIERDGVLRLYRKLNVQYPGFDLITHYDKTHLKKLKQYGINAIEFQLPVNLEWYRRRPGTSIDFDLFFSGRSTPHREELMKTLKRRYRFLHVAHGLIDYHYVDFVNRSLICLNINIDGFPQLQHRMQNMMACGAFVMSEKQTHEDALKAGQHYVHFSGNDIPERMSYFLQRPDARKKIADAGMEFVKQNFNAEKNWKQLIDKI